MADFLFTDSLTIFALVTVFGIIAGTVKGAIGFAMPMILISSLSSFMPPEVALAGLILPTVATNIAQALRQGVRVAIDSVVKFRVFLIFGGVVLLFSAQLVLVIPANTLLLFLGVMIVGFCLMQLLGVFPKSVRPSAIAEAIIGTFAGFAGGMSGVWGPPTVAYLTAIGTEKNEQMRVQGVIYGLGAVVLLLAHLQSGILNRETLPLSLYLLLPAGIGMAIGFRLHDQIDQGTFRRATLIVLIIAGLNLIRRGLV